MTELNNKNANACRRKVSKMTTKHLEKKNLVEIKKLCKLYQETLDVKETYNTEDYTLYYDSKLDEFVLLKRQEETGEKKRITGKGNILKELHKLFLSMPSFSGVAKILKDNFEQTKLVATHLEYKLTLHVHNDYFRVTMITKPWEHGKTVFYHEVNEPQSLAVEPITICTKTIGLIAKKLEIEITEDEAVDILLKTKKDKALIQLITKSIMLKIYQYDRFRQDG